jgi:hypothetical protein
VSVSVAPLEDPPYWATDKFNEYSWAELNYIKKGMGAAKRPTSRLLQYTLTKSTWPLRNVAKNMSDPAVQFFFI